MPASYKTCPPYPAGVVYSLLIGPKTIDLTALTLSLAHAPNRETLPLNSFIENLSLFNVTLHCRKCLYDIHASSREEDCRFYSYRRSFGYFSKVFLFQFLEF